MNNIIDFFADEEHHPCSSPTDHRGSLARYDDMSVTENHIEHDFAAIFELFPPKPVPSVVHQPQQIKRVFSDRNQIFTIVRDELPTPSSNEETMRMSEKSKRIQKREKAKSRSLAQKQQLVQSLSNEESSEYEPSPYGQDQYVNKKLLQQMRNRISAQTSRDKKRNHLNILAQENNKLKQENADLMAKLAEMQRQLEDQAKKTNEILQFGDIDALSVIQRELQHGDTDVVDTTPTRHSNGYYTRGGLFGIFSLVSVLLILGFFTSQPGSPNEAAKIPLIPRLLQTLVPVPGATSGMQSTQQVQPVQQNKQCCNNYFSHASSELLEQIRKLKEEVSFKLNKQCNGGGNANNTSENPTKKTNLRATESATQLATVDYFKPKMETLLCPAGVIFNNEKPQRVVDPSNEMEIEQGPSGSSLPDVPQPNAIDHFKADEWLQVYIPLTNLTYVNGDNRPVNYYQDEGSDAKIIELMCKIGQVREITTTATSTSTPTTKPN